MIFKKLRKKLFPTRTELQHQRDEIWLQIASVYQSRFPESYNMLNAAIHESEGFYQKFGDLILVDGVSVKGMFDGLDMPQKVYPDEIFEDLFITRHGVMAVVDWKESNDEVYHCVQGMLSSYGMSGFDWSFKAQHDDEAGTVAEFLDLIDQKLKGTGYRLNLFNTQGDNLAFAVVDDANFEKMSQLEPHI